MYCNDKEIMCENASLDGKCQVTACTKQWVDYNPETGIATLRISESGYKPYPKDYFSLINWNTDFTHLPTECDLLVMFKEDRYDRVNYYTADAWVVNSKPGEPIIWISNNEQIFDEAIMWARLPEYKDLRSF